MIKIKFGKPNVSGIFGKPSVSGIFFTWNSIEKNY